jgi:putative endonuclease
MFKIYILKSSISNKYYIGHTQNLDKRLERHNTGFSQYTKKFMPWKLIYTEDFETRGEAIKREKQIKRYKGGEAFKRLIKK